MQKNNRNSQNMNTLNKARNVFGNTYNKKAEKNNKSHPDSNMNIDEPNNDNQSGDNNYLNTDNENDYYSNDGQNIDNSYNDNNSNHSVNDRNKNEKYNKDNQKENGFNKKNNSQNTDKNNSLNFSNKTDPFKNDGAGKIGGKDAEKNVGKDIGDAAKNALTEDTKAKTTDSAKKAASSVSAVGKGTGAVVTGTFLSTLIPFIAITVAFVMVLSAIFSILCGNMQVETDILTSEAQEIMYVFNSFVYTSNDDEKTQYQAKLEKIKGNGYSATLCAMWKGLVVDYYFTPISETDFYVEQYDKDSFSSPYECAFNDYCACYYLERTDKGYVQKNFDDCGYDKDKYFKIAPHYHYLNNIMKMCIDSFINPDTNKVYENPNKFLNKYKIRNKDKIKEKKMSDEEVEEACRKAQIRKIIKNLEGKDGLAKKCITYEGEKDGKKYKIPFIKLLHDDKKFLYNRKNLTLKKGIYDSIINYDYIFRMGGDATDICELAKSELGKKGKDYCYGQTKAWGNNGLTQWCAIFQAYLLEQTGINPSDVGWSASCSAWISNATEKGLYHSRESGYKPQAGDILFFNWGHVGIVYSVDGTKLVTIEGNTDSNDKSTSVVGQHDNYTTNSTSIKGYISMSSFYVNSGDNGQVKTKVIDSSYIGHKVKLTNTERKKIEALVTNENSVNKYVGCLLLAQCMRDAIYDGRAKAISIKKDMGYSASDSGSACEEAKRAVKKIFDEGGYAVKHRILYMYNPYYCKSTWHESQLFVCEHGEGINRIRYFDAKN